MSGSRQQGLALFGDEPMAGVDEAGRGPLAGPVVAAAVILDAAALPAGLADSKVLSEPRRERLADEIRAHARAWAVAWAEPAEIDALNILQATLLAMRRAVEGLSLRPVHVQVDGNRCPPLAGCTVEAVIRGDALVPAISAASILAKVARDQWMRRSHQHWPGYGFDRHKGYGTAAHMAALDREGPCAIHRRSFGPVQQRAREPGGIR